VEVGQKTDASTAFSPLPWGSEVKNPAVDSPSRLPKPGSSLLLLTRLQEDDDLPVTGMKSHRLYAARRAVEAEYHMVHAEKFAALPNYLHDICRKNPGSWHDIKTNEHTGEFMAPTFYAFGRVRTRCGANENSGTQRLWGGLRALYFSGIHLNVPSSYIVNQTVPLSLRI
jgi:hypothetical protein